MRTRQRLLTLICGVILGGSALCAAEIPAGIENLVEEFPSLEELEARLGAKPAAKRHSANSSSYYTKAGWWSTASEDRTNRFRPRIPLAAGSSVVNAPLAADSPFAPLLMKWEASQKEAADLAGRVNRKNNRLINKYFMDRIVSNARTDYGTAITGLFAQGVGFGTFEQALRQNYTTIYSLPLLTRFSGSSNWKRILAGWTISSSVGVEPKLSELLQVQDFLRGLRLSWSVALNYNLPWTNVRKIADHQFRDEAALAQAADRAVTTRDELVKKMAARLEELAANPPVGDTKLESLRELYPQFELYRTRFQQAGSCEERLEHFFTLKGLALSLLTLAGYDHPGKGATDLLATWKKARNLNCEVASAALRSPDRR